MKYQKVESVSKHQTTKKLKLTQNFMKNVSFVCVFWAEENFSEIWEIWKIWESLQKHFVCSRKDINIFLRIIDYSAEKMNQIVC